MVASSPTRDCGPGRHAVAERNAGVRSPSTVTLWARGGAEAVLRSDATIVEVCRESMGSCDMDVVGWGCGMGTGGLP